MKHKLVFFEGTSGVGKSETCSLATDYLVGTGANTQKIKYPTPYLRDMIQEERYAETRDPFLESYLFAADFRNLVFRQIMPVEDETIFMFDRSYVTSCADSNYGENSVENVLEINRHNPRPDLLFILHCSPDVAMKRIKQRMAETGKPISKRETAPYIANLRERYLSIADLMNNVVLVDTEQPLEKVVSDVTEKIREIL